MNIQDFLAQLQKIKNYAENLDELESISALDEAILKKNVEKLYEIVIHDYLSEDKAHFAKKSKDNKGESHKVRSEHIAFQKPQEEVAEKPVAKQEVEKAEETETDEQEKNPSAPQENPVSYESPSAEVESSPNGQASQTAVVEQKETSESEKRISEIQENKRVHDAKPELKALFDFREGSDLSDKLSQTPVKDIMKAMGLNERIFTQNELFGGNNELFKNNIAKLNSFDTYEEARRFLIGGVAQKYNWHEADRKQIAINFIRLVHRRYK